MDAYNFFQAGFVRTVLLFRFGPPEKTCLA